jgi:hypothetical protein
MGNRIVIAAAASALALTGCGSDASKKVDTEQIRSVVRQFAAADGPKACELLSPQGLVNVYGGFTKPVSVARQECLRRSAKFRGERIQLKDIEVVDDANVRIGALNHNGTVSYNVKLVRLGPSWRIEKINQSKVD